jgi:hypothetical protein
MHHRVGDAWLVPSVLIDFRQARSPSTIRRTTRRSRVCPMLKLGARSPSFRCRLRDVVPVAVCECVLPCVVMIITNVNLLFVLLYSCMTLLFD